MSGQVLSGAWGHIHGARSHTSSFCLARALHSVRICSMLPSALQIAHCLTRVLGTFRPFLSLFHTIISFVSQHPQYSSTASESLTRRCKFSFAASPHVRVWAYVPVSLCRPSLVLWRSVSPLACRIPSGLLGLCSLAWLFLRLPLPGRRIPHFPGYRCDPLTI